MTALSIPLRAILSFSFRQVNFRCRTELNRLNGASREYFDVKHFIFSSVLTENIVTPLIS